MYMFLVCSILARMVSVVTTPKTDRERAQEAEATFRLGPGLHLLGSLERGVTVYSQQVRAHNLVWALWELQRNGGPKLGRVAVIGGGVAGLTVAACLLSLADDNISVTLFEQLWDLCPIQQGSDTRWLHPRIYYWPAEGSRAPSASLPVLNWSEGRASDVARTIGREFSLFCQAFAQSGQRLAAFLGLQNFNIDASTREIFWIGHRAKRTGAFFQLEGAEGQRANFDTIIIAVGFGLETRTEYPTESYWRNEQLGQPILDGSQRRYLVSGYGDGALVDLCRLTIERFRQDTIVNELFDPELERVEGSLSEELRRVGENANVFELLRTAENNGLLRPARDRLRDRIRKDTRVVLHVRGRNAEVRDLPHIFGRHSSFLHRLITYLLFRCGAFGLDFSPLSEAVERHQVAPSQVLCRYGANTLQHLRMLFIDPDLVASRLAEIKDKQQQVARWLWAPGVFRDISQLGDPP